MLQNYETRLWFTVVFIPLIPLQKKQILNYCPVCSRHYAPSATEWAKVQDNSIGEATQQLTSNPNSIEAGLKLFNTLAGFRKNEQAEELAQVLLRQFSNSADVHLHVAGWYESLRRKADADALFQKALQIEPNNLMAKRAVAIGLLENNDPDRAKKLLDSVPVVSVRDMPDVHFVLGKGYQATHRHREALDVFQQIVQVSPNVGNDAAFRTAVKQSEKAVGATSSLLKTMPLMKRPVLVWSMVAVAAVIAFLGLNFYISQHRTLTAVNGFSVPIQVQLDDGAAITLEAQGRQELTVAEGPHHAVVKFGDELLRDNEFNIESSFFGRVFKRPEYILNAAGGAVVVRHDVTYSDKLNANRKPPTLKFHVGDTFLELSDIDFRFQEFPKVIDVKEGVPERKSRVDLLRVDPLSALDIAMRTETFAPEVIVDYLESHLRCTPTEQAFYAPYVSWAVNTHGVARPKAFFAKRLDQRPVNIEWHRTHQELAKLDHSEVELAAQYQKWLDQEPNNSALLYLRGRLEQHPDKAVAFYDQAIAADKTNPFPVRAKGWRTETQGDLAGARRWYEQAHQLAPQDHQTVVQFIAIQFGLRDYPAVEKATATAIETDPFDIEIRDYQFATFMAQGREDKATQSMASLEEAITQQNIDVLVLQIYKISFAYFKRDYRQIEEIAGQMPTATGKKYLFQAQLEQGNYTDAFVDPPAGLGLGNADVQFLAALAWREKGEVAKSRDSLKAALDQLKAGSLEDQAAAELLAEPGKVTAARARELMLDSVPKAILLAAIAPDVPAIERKAILDLAEKLNYRPQFPHQFLQRTIAQMKAK